jgi:hypothetical protein
MAIGGTGGESGCSVGGGAGEGITVSSWLTVDAGGHPEMGRVGASNWPWRPKLSYGGTHLTLQGCMRAPWRGGLPSGKGLRGVHFHSFGSSGRVRA